MADRNQNNVLIQNKHERLHFKRKLDGQGRARREAARRRKSECKVNLDILNSSRSRRANDSKNCILEHVAYGLASAYSVRALRVCQYARNNFFVCGPKFIT